jgi:hypothetical protein
MELSVHFIDFQPGAPDRLVTTVTQAAVAAEEGGATMFTLAEASRCGATTASGGPRRRRVEQHGVERDPADIRLTAARRTSSQSSPRCL